MSKKTKNPVDILLPGDGILYRHEKGWLGNSIIKAQIKAGISEADAQYTHIETSLSGEWAMSATPPRLRVVDITKRYPGRYIKIVRYRHCFSDKKRGMVGIWAATLNNTGYDTHGVLNFIKFLSRWVKEKASKWFCSEAFLYAWQKEFPQAVDGKNPREFMPGHALYYVKDFRVVWEGYIPKA